MKKIFTLAIAVLFTGLLFAADRKPTVTINNSRSYEVVIDGKSFYGSTNAMVLPFTKGALHTIKVYEMRRGLFVKGKKLLDAATFRMNSSDMVITIDRDGDISVRETRGNGRFDRNDRSWDKPNDRDFGKNDRGQKGRF